jgi:hypothetical protein
MPLAIVVRSNHSVNFIGEERLTIEQPDLGYQKIRRKSRNNLSYSKR